ncbi:hypothetical protein E2C01_048313 [Portunus trituberculatus]|uniref:Uncharacterized protein n=1 Tax=Portunus trituberculatus TaxID=210409 RepID=A0A5B7GAD8_PORTR|nr:hypothetical protein [Portunus trituberculatus]
MTGRPPPRHWSDDTRIGISPDPLVCLVVEQTVPTSASYRVLESRVTTTHMPAQDENRTLMPATANSRASRQPPVGQQSPRSKFLPYDGDGGDVAALPQDAIQIAVTPAPVLD